MSEEKRIVIVGVGGLGSWLAPAIGRSLEYQAPGSILLLVDGDSFEEKNTERQVFNALGNKAVVTRELIQPQLMQTYVVAEAAWVVDESLVEDVDPEEEAGTGKISPSQLLNEGDVVYAIVDNYATRKLLLDAAVNYDDIDIFVAGNGSPETGDPLYGSIIHYCRRNGQEVTHHPSVHHYEFVTPPDKNPGELSCAERAKLDGGTQLLAVNLGVTAYLMAKSAMALFGDAEQQVLELKHSEICFDMGHSIIAEYDQRTEYGIEYCNQLLGSAEKSLVSA